VFSVKTQEHVDLLRNRDGAVPVKCLWDNAFQTVLRNIIKQFLCRVDDSENEIIMVFIKHKV